MPKEFKPFQLSAKQDELTPAQEARVLALVDAYVNSPGGLRLKTGIDTAEGWAISADGSFTTSKQITSTLATGTAPFSITSTTVVSNLNVDQVDGYDFNQSLTTTGTPTFASVTISGDTFVLSTSKTPSSASDTGTQGQIAWDSNYLYICIATNTWQRVAHATW